MKTRLLTTLTAAIMALSSWAQKEQSDIMYFLFDKETKTASVTPGKLKYEGNIIIPASVTDPYDGTTYSVTSIGEAAFYLCTGLTSITIPNSVTSIGEFAFAGCTGLTRITIPNSVTSIGSEAFYLCTGLTSITIGNSVTSIGRSAFSGCTGLTSITIPNSVTSIGGLAFRHCSGLTSIIIPSSVTSIDHGAFSYCTSLTSIKVEAGNTKYDSRDNCNAIIETASNTLVAGCKATTIPSSVTSIGSEAFYECSGLTSITIPSSVTSIGDYAFSYCTGLTVIKALRTDPAAYNCSADAFNDYSAILDIPLGCEDAYKAIEPWSEFHRMKIEINGIYYAIDDRTLTATVMSPGNSNTGSITIPASVTFKEKNYSVTSIGTSAFGWCKRLKRVNIPNTVTTIGDWAFYCCRSLKSITIPNAVTSIGSSAFSGCTNLKSVTIPSSVTSIGRWAFDYCFALKNITIPASVTDISVGAFNGCTGLKSITALRTNPKEYHCDTWAFEEITAYRLLRHRATLHVPAGCKTAYENCAPWSNFSSIIDDAKAQ